MRNYFYLLTIFLLASCATSKENSLTSNKCQYLDSYRTFSEQLLVYQCEEDPKEMDCHIVRDKQCLFRVNRNLPPWMNR